MSLPVYFEDRASAEITDAFLWYESELEGLGTEFMAEVEATLFLIGHMQELYPAKRKKYREALIDRFPFLIIYKIDDEEECIIVLSVFHTSRNPRKKPR